MSRKLKDSLTSTAKESQLTLLIAQKGLVTDLRQNIINPSRKKVKSTFSRLTRYIRHLQQFADTYTKVAGAGKAYLRFMQLIKEKNGSSEIDLSDLSRVWRAWANSPTMCGLFVESLANESALWYASAAVDRVQFGDKDTKQFVDLTLDGEPVTRAAYLEHVKDEICLLAETLGKSKEPRKLSRLDLDTIVVTYAQGLLTNMPDLLKKSQVTRAKGEANKVISSLLNDKVAEKDIESTGALTAYKQALGKLAEKADMEVSPKGVVKQAKRTANRASKDASMWQLLQAVVLAEGLPTNASDAYKANALTVAKYCRQYLRFVEFDSETGQTTVQESVNGKKLVETVSGLQAK